MTSPEQQDTLAPLAARLAQLQEARDLLDGQIDQVKAQIRDAVPGPDKYAAGPLTVVVSHAARLDLAAVAAKYPADQHPELYETTPSTKKVRAHLAPTDLEPLTTYGSPSVRLQ